MDPMGPMGPVSDLISTAVRHTHTPYPSNSSVSYTVLSFIIPCMSVFSPSTLTLQLPDSLALPFSLSACSLRAFGSLSSMHFFKTVSRWSILWSVVTSSWSEDHWRQWWVWIFRFWSKDDQQAPRSEQDVITRSPDLLPRQQDGHDGRTWWTDMMDGHDGRSWLNWFIKVYKQLIKAAWCVSVILS